MEYKRTTSIRSIFWGGYDAIAKHLTLLERKVNSVIKNWTFISRE